MDDLIAQGVQVVVLGCTELPLLLRGSTLERPGGRPCGWSIRPTCWQNAAWRMHWAKAQR
jgi:aspartate racemase